MVNRVILVGRVGRAPQQQHLKDKPITALTVETWREWEGKKFTEWHAVVVHGKNAEAAAALEVGQLVLVEGSIQSRSWTDDQGTKHRQVEVSAASLSRLERPALVPANV